MASDQRPCNVLFLCTGNSARSIIAAVALRLARKLNAIGKTASPGDAAASPRAA